MGCLGAETEEPETTTTKTTEWSRVQPSSGQRVFVLNSKLLALIIAGLKKKKKAPCTVPLTFSIDEKKKREGDRERQTERRREGGERVERNREGDRNER